MAVFYKTFLSRRIALMALMLSFFFFSMLPAALADLYTVENVVVDVTAANALKAREEAFSEAQIKAFEELSGRMLTEDEMLQFTAPDPMTISTMIQDYEVSDEKLSSKRYSGTYKFRFKDSAVKRFFSKSGTSYTDVVSKPLLVLPFIDNGSRTILWSDANMWLQAWSSAANLESGVVPLVVPLGDVADVSDINDGDALTYDTRRLNGMLRRYNASEAVIAIARPEGTGLNIQLYRTDRERPEYVHQILERALPNQTEAQLYNRAVQSVKTTLRKDWKQKTVVESPQAAGSVQVRVRFNSLQAWADMQRKLARVQGLSDIMLLALSPKDAYLSLSFPGSMDRLELALKQADLYLQPVYEQAPGLNADYSRGLLNAYKKDKPRLYELSRTPVPTQTPTMAPPSAPVSPSYAPASAGSGPPAQAGSSSYQTRF